VASKQIHVLAEKLSQFPKPRRSRKNTAPLNLGASSTATLFPAWHRVTLGRNLREAALTSLKAWGECGILYTNKAVGHHPFAEEYAFDREEMR
jgi:hypothetical protein